MWKFHFEGIYIAFQQTFKIWEDSINIHCLILVVQDSFHGAAADDDFTCFMFWLYFYKTQYNITLPKRNMYYTINK